MNKEYYHATEPDNIESIVSGGFRLPVFFSDDPKADNGRSKLPVEGYLGQGIYISRDWRTALEFGRALLLVQLVQGTRILDVSEKPNMKIIDSLRREFGKELLSHKALLHKIIPWNKHLKLKELIELTKYHYHNTWTGDPPPRIWHGKALCGCWSMLRRYKFDGYGHATSDIGIIILSPDKIIFKELIAVLRRPYYGRKMEFDSIEELKSYFRKNGENKYIEIADKFTSADN